MFEEGLRIIVIKMRGHLLHKIISGSKGVWSEAIVYTIAGTLPQAFNYILLPLYLRFLTPTDYGILGYVNAIVWFISVTNTLSINAFYMRRYYEKNDKKGFTGSIFYFLLIVNIILIFVEGIGLYFIFKWHHVSVNFYPYMFLALIEVFFTTFSIIPLRYFRLESLVKQYLWFNVILLCLKHGFAIFLVTGLRLSVYGFLLGGALSAGVMAIYVMASAPSFARLTIDVGIIRKALRFSLPLLPGAYATVALMLVDRLILEKYVSLSELGIYSLGYTMATAVNIVVSSMLIVIEPRVYKISTLETYKPDYQRLLDIYMFVLFVMVLMFVLFINNITYWLFPAVYNKAAIISMIVSISTIFYGIQNIAGLQFLLYNNTVVLSAITMIAALLNIGLNFMFIPLYGIYAAAVVTVLSYFLGMMLAVMFAERVDKGMVIRKKDYHVSIAFIITLILSSFLGDKELFQFGVKVFIFSVFVVYCSRRYSIKLISLSKISIAKTVGQDAE